MSGCSIDENAVCTTAWIYLRISDNGRAHKAVEEPPRKTDGRTDNALRVRTLPSPDTTSGHLPSCAGGSTYRARPGNGEFLVLSRSIALLSNIWPDSLCLGILSYDWGVTV